MKQHYNNTKLTSLSDIGNSLSAAKTLHMGNRTSCLLVTQDPTQHFQELPDRSKHSTAQHTMPVHLVRTDYIFYDGYYSCIAVLLVSLRQSI